MTADERFVAVLEFPRLNRQKLAVKVAIPSEVRNAQKVNQKKGKMRVKVEAVVSYGSMGVKAVLTGYGGAESDAPIYLTSDCRSENDFASQIDNLIHQLAELKGNAKLKFEELNRSSN